MFSSNGYSVRVADGVAAALRAAQIEPVDVLISDIGLPDGSGLDLMAQLIAKGPI
jgi:DNA-binding response OmpR family regulator